jgi:hypothetical protein
MNLTQLEIVEMELKRKIYGQNKVLKLTGLKRRSRGHQECLKQINTEKCGQNKVQGLFCEETGLPGAYLHETRG